VDFERLNAGITRFQRLGRSTCARAIFVYFDSHDAHDPPRARHGRAARLPPRFFPPSRSKASTTGTAGLVSNTAPCNGWSSKSRGRDTVAFQVDLWSGTRRVFPAQHARSDDAGEGDPLLQPLTRGGHRSVQACSAAYAAPLPACLEKAARRPEEQPGGAVPSPRCRPQGPTISFSLIYRAKNYEGLLEGLRVFHAPEWRNIGAPVTTMPDAHCGIARFCSDPSNHEGVFTFRSCC